MARGKADNGWTEYRRLVLSELKRLNDSMDQRVQGLHDSMVDRFAHIDQLCESQAREMAALKVDIARLQVKSGVWGGLAGIMSAIGTVLVALIGFKLGK